MAILIPSLPLFLSFSYLFKSRQHTMHFLEKYARSEQLRKNTGLLAYDNVSKNIDSAAACLFRELWYQRNVNTRH
jgi:hypothetical protein